MFWDEHAPPHFHALYGEHEVLIAPLQRARLAHALLESLEAEDLFRSLDG